MILGITKDTEKAKVKSDIKLARAAESLEQIANDMDEWIGQQRDRFKSTKIAFRKKWISRWFSDFVILELFKDKLHKKHFGDIVYTFRLYMPDIAESLREIWYNFLSCAKFMRQVQNAKNRVGDNHDLEYWCANFLDTAVTPTVERLRHLAEQTREYLAAPKQAETVEKRPQGLLNKQVGKLLRTSASDISASEIAKILNENYVGVYKPITPCSVGKTEHWKKHREKKKSCRKS